MILHAALNARQKDVSPARLLQRQSQHQIHLPPLVLRPLPPPCLAGDARMIPTTCGRTDLRGDVTGLLKRQRHVVKMLQVLRHAPRPATRASSMILTTSGRTGRKGDVTGLRRKQIGAVAMVAMFLAVQ